MKTITNLTKYGTLLMLLMTVSMSCKKSFLEIVPKGKLIAETTSDYDLLLNSLNLLNFGSANSQVYMGDDVAAVDPNFSAADLRTQRLFKWADVIYEPDEDAGEIQTPMQNIYTYNKVINGVMNSTDGTEQQKKSIRAEAMAGRAWTYFLLINYFGKPYNATTSSTDLGFPIVKEADVTETKYTRASVKEVYDFILNDLTTAIPDLPAQTTNRLRMSKAAAEGLLGKVYVFMGRYNDALTAFNTAFTTLSNSAIPVELYDYNTAFNTGGAFFPLDPLFGPTTPTSGDNTESLYAKQFSNFWIISSELVINPQTVDLFGASDLRLKFFSSTPFPFGSDYPLGMLRRMGPLTAPFGVLLPDLYLLRAECKARLEDFSGAVADVKALRIKRMPATDADVPGSVTSQKVPLLKFILDERVREFAELGVRWFDMRRLSVDPLFAGTTYTHTLYSESGAPTVFTLKPERFVLRIPGKVLHENPGMTDNP